MKKQENVILIGMSGAGKSTLGVLLAKALGKSFVDTDLLIQQRAGKRLQAILDEDGMEFFLRLEEEVVSSLEAVDCVIATGGSVVYSERAMTHLRHSGVTVYLEVAFEELSRRLSNITTRGIVFKGSQDLRSVYEERLPLYERYADLRLPCEERDIETAVAQLVALLTEDGE